MKIMTFFCIRKDKQGGSRDRRDLNTRDRDHRGGAKDDRDHRGPGKDDRDHRGVKDDRDHRSGKDDLRRGIDEDRRRDDDKSSKVNHKVCFTLVSLGRFRVLTNNKK